MLAETPKLLLLGKENLGVSPMPVSIGIQVLGNGNLVTYPFATKVRIRGPSNLNCRNTHLIDFYFKDCRRGGLLSDNSSLPECNLSPEPNPGVLMIFFIAIHSNYNYRYNLFRNIRKRGSGITIVQGWCR